MGKSKRMKLGVNIDHIATLREARKINDPDPLEAIFVAKNAGADQITIHLREDRRHINDDDCAKIIKSSILPVNIECSINSEIIKIVSNLRPHRATIVPEKRNEITTEGGLDLGIKNLIDAISILKSQEIEVSLFIEPRIENIEISKELGADMVELHTGLFSNLYLMLHSNLPYTRNSLKELELKRSKLKDLLINEIQKIRDCAKKANELNLPCAAGHGLNYQNVKLIREIPHIFELNIGQSIIAKAIFVGLFNAIKEMKELLRD